MVCFISREKDMSSFATIHTKKRFGIIKRVLNGECLKTIAKEFNAGLNQIEFIIHSRCYEIAPDFYKTGRRVEKRAKQILVLPPSITWLRENKEKFIGTATP